MLNTEDDLTNIEILRIARDLAYSDYNNRKAELHNQWLSQSDFMWRTKRLRVAYPPIPQYPTEHEIVMRAIKLLEFINRPTKSNEEHPSSSVSTEHERLLEQTNETIIAPALVEKENELTVNQPDVIQVSEVLKEPSTDLPKDGGIIPTVKNFFKF